jgi:hypothetical protein
VGLFICVCGDIWRVEHLPYGDLRIVVVVREALAAI